MSVTLTCKYVVEKACTAQKLVRAIRLQRKELWAQGLNSDLDTLLIVF
jgi:hypothetical protein